MSEFENEYAKLRLELDNVDSLMTHDTLMAHFKDWQPPKKLVEVPKFVADFIENKKGDMKLYGAFRKISKKMYGTDLYWWVFANGDRQESFAKAWIDGYTVEKEQLYIIKYPMTLNPYVLCTGKNEDNEIVISGHTSVKASAKRFTEKEIKALDERLMAFAVKVDDVES